MEEANGDGTAARRSIVNTFHGLFDLMLDSAVIAPTIASSSIDAFFVSEMAICRRLQPGYFISIRQIILSIHSRDDSSFFFLLFLCRFLRVTIRSKRRTTYHRISHGTNALRLLDLHLPKLYIPQ